MSRVGIKYDNRLLKSLTNAFGFIALVTSLATFITGKTDISSFLKNVSLISLLLTIGKTMIAYCSALIALGGFLFGVVFDLILRIFGLDFPIVRFIYSLFVDRIILAWWWEASSSEEIFLSAVLLFLLATIRIETENWIFTLFYDRYEGGVSIGFLHFRHK